MVVISRTKLGIFKENKSLANHSGFGCGGRAEILFIPANAESLIEFVKTRDKINEFQGKVLNVVGAGFNLLIRDGLIKGISILTRSLNKIEIKNNKIVVGCGATNQKLFNFAKKNSLGGFEFLACIPGTVGGACSMNAGCYDCDVAGLLHSITAVDFEGNVHKFSADECNFSYRANGLPKNLIFLEAVFNMTDHRSAEEVDRIFRQLWQKKVDSQPIGCRTCGSTFKNPQVMPAWKVIRNLGLQGVDFEGVEFSKKHANFIVNHSSSKASAIENLIKLAQQRAKAELDIVLEPELRIIGDGNDL